MKLLNHDSVPVAMVVRPVTSGEVAGTTEAAATRRPALNTRPVA